MAAPRKRAHFSAANRDLSSKPLSAFRRRDGDLLQSGHVAIMHTEGHGLRMIAGLAKDEHSRFRLDGTEKTLHGHARGPAFAALDHEAGIDEAGDVMARVMSSPVDCA